MYKITEFDYEKNCEMSHREVLSFESKTTPGYIEGVDLSTLSEDAKKRVLNLVHEFQNELRDATGSSWRKFTESKASNVEKIDVDVKRSRLQG